MFIKFSFLLIFFTFSEFIAFSQIAVIANKNAPKTNLTSERILDIYSLNVQFWNNGAKIKVFDLKGEQSPKFEFFTLLGSSPVDMKKIWLKKQFSGKGMPPEALDSEEEMLKKVANTPGAIGFVKANKVNKEVIVLAIIE